MQYASSAVIDVPRDDDPLDGGDPAGSSRTKKRRKKYRTPLWARLLVIFGMIIAVASVSSIVGVKVLVSQATKSITQKNLLGGAAVQHASINGAQNILLVGLDNRPGQNPTDLVRADSIIVVHIDAAHDAGYLVSIPRDTYVKIPAYPKTHYLGSSDKINAAFAFGNMKGGGPSGGVELLADTINSLYGITFNAAAIVDFDGFQQVVTVLGGVNMYVDEETTSAHIGTDNKTGKFAAPFKIDPDSGKIVRAIPGVTPVTYHVGYQHLAPWQALDFVRQRELLKNGDYDRERHQQQFIKAIFKEILSKNVLLDPGKLASVLNVVGKAMTVDTQGVKIEDWIYAMRSLNSNNLITIKSNNGTFHGEPLANGQLVETLDANTIALLQAVKSDTVGAFILDHRDLVTNS